MTENKVRERCLLDILPEDVLELIISQIFYDDCSGFRSFCCFRAACRTFRHLSTNVLKRKKFPVLVYLAPDNTFINFINPILNSTSKETILVTANIYEEQNKEEETVLQLESESLNEEEAGLEFKYLSSIKHKKIYCSKDGWLLVFQGSCEIFFVNPFTKQRIDLPDLPLSLFAGMSFSSAPTSPDCIVFGIDVSPKFVVVISISRGSSDWSTFHRFPNDSAQFMPSHSNPIFYKGLFYFMGDSGKLGIYDPKKGGELDAWRVLDNLKDACDSTKESYLTEYGGELVAVFTGHVGKWVHVYMLDHSEMAWKKIEKLGDNLLFLSRATSLSTTKTKVQLPGLENKIYFPRVSKKDGLTLFYNLLTNKFQTLWNEYYTEENYYGTKEFQNCAWIEPNYNFHNDEQLSWEQ